MKTRNTIKPEKLEIYYYDKYEKCIVKFNTNIQEEQIEKENAEIEIMYKYDSYSIKTWYRKTLKADIEKDYDTWLEYAKQQEYNEYAEIVRNKRNELLQETDKEMILDRLKLELPETITATSLLSVVKDFFTNLKDIINSPMAEYRQKLRDIPQQERISL